MPRKDFVDVLRDVAAKNNLEFLSLSHDWIIQVRDPRSGKVCSVFGYTFDINGAGAVEICKEKAATSLVLAQCGVSNIPHHVFLNPANEMTSGYVKKAGNWSDIQALIEKLTYPVVLKPLKGTGGIGVVKATCGREVEAAVQQLFGVDYGIAVSPYKDVIDEYRCICLDGKAQLVYRKVRTSVTGDGTSSVAALVAQQLTAAGPEEAAGITKAAAALAPEDLARVPAKGEAAPLQWKHNLGLGACVDLEVDASMQAGIEQIAAKASNAIGIRFCSVDVVNVKDEGLMIMEVNGGVMMDSLIGLLGDKGKALATRMYGAAVLSALGLPIPEQSGGYAA